MRKITPIVILAIALILPNTNLIAETRLNFKFDITDALVPQPRGSINYTGFEGEFEFNWHATNKHIGTQTQASQTQSSQTQTAQTQKAKSGHHFFLRHLLPDGFAAGFRKENTLVYEGDFLYIRFFKKTGSYRSLEFYPSLALVYGVPLSNQFSATKFNTDRTQYESVFLVHNVTTFFNGGIKKNGVLYPELTLGIRKNFRRFNVDLVPGIRILKFGILKSGGFYAPSDFKTKTALCPTIGIRLGLKI